MSSIERFAHLLKVNITKIRATVTAHETVEGSLFAETISGGCSNLETTFEVESDDDPAKVAMVLRNAHRVCIVGNTVRNGVPQQNAFTLNGQTIDPEAYPPVPRA